MKKPFYLLQHGHLKREANTVVFQNKNIKKVLPINSVSQIYCLGETTVNTQLLKLLTQHHIPIYFFNHYGYFIGSYTPREYLLSGSMIVKQVEHYLDPNKRLKIAMTIVKTTQLNIQNQLNYYLKRGYSLVEERKKNATLIQEINACRTISKLMKREAESWIALYNALEEVLKETPFNFERRTRQPPHNEANALISFLNTVLYTTALTEVYHTQLNPTISFLHEPGVRRFSLALDIAEMFKPYCTFQALFKLIRKRQIKPSHFQKEFNKCLLNDQGKQIVLQEFEQRMKKTHRVPTLKMNASTRRLIRLECYKLIKHLLGERTYQAIRL